MREETMELLEEQDLAHLKDEVAGSLPYGLQRRLEIARALATEPQAAAAGRAGRRHEPPGDPGAEPSSSSRSGTSTI